MLYVKLLLTKPTSPIWHRGPFEDGGRAGVSAPQSAACWDLHADQPGFSGKRPLERAKSSWWAAVRGRRPDWQGDNKSLAWTQSAYVVHPPLFCSLQHTSSRKLPPPFRRSFSDPESFMFPAAAFFFSSSSSFNASCTYISAKWVRELIATENQYLLICDAITVEHSRLLWSKQGSVMFLLNCIYSCLHQR